MPASLLAATGKRQNCQRHSRKQKQVAFSAEAAPPEENHSVSCHPQHHEENDMFRADSDGKASAGQLQPLCSRGAPPRGTEAAAQLSRGPRARGSSLHPPAACDAATGPLRTPVGEPPEQVSHRTRFYLKSAMNVLTRVPIGSPEPREHLECPALRRWQGSPDPKGPFWRRDVLPS